MHCTPGAHSPHFERTLYQKIPGRSRATIYTAMLAGCWRRFVCPLALLGVTMLLYGKQDAEQLSGKKSVISQSLSHYLRLTDQQSVALADALEKYNDVIESKRSDQRTARMRAAADPSVNANRLIEQDQLEIQKARVEARSYITKILSEDQLSQLKELATEQPRSAEQARIAGEAARLGLVKRRTTAKQPFGGTVPIFSADTASQPDIDQPAVTKRPLAKRPPPTSPPQ